MEEDRPTDQGRAWRGGHEEEGGYGPSGLRTVESAPDGGDLAGAVEAAFGRNTFLDASAIEVEGDDGIVTLSGTVGNREARHLAGAIAEAVPGVRAVRNRITIDSADGVADPDPVNAPTL